MGYPKKVKEKLSSGELDEKKTAIAEASLVLNAKLGPVYLREGTAIPVEVGPERVVYIERVFIDPPQQPPEQLPEIVEPFPAIERPSLQTFNRPLPLPK